MKLGGITPDGLADDWIFEKCPFGQVGFCLCSAIAVSLSATRDPSAFLFGFTEIRIMTIFLVLLVGGFAVAAAAALIRGLMAFLRDAEHIRETGDVRQEAFGVKQDRKSVV